jgi:DeoR family transcriptional regulator, glycerol-3-phosphate regulon repressor
MSGTETQSRATARRQAAIMALVRETGRVSVEEMAARFAVTPQTIRRDLNELSEARVLTRVHGGAVIASSVENLAYEARKLVAQDQKRLIGQAAAELIPDHSSLFINLGTTTEEVARAIAGRTGLLVVTNNINVAMELYRNRAIEMVIAGGSIRPSDGGIIGHMAVETIRNYSVDLAVIGTSAIDEEGTLLDYDVREVQVSRAIIENARQVILVVDSSKFSRRAPVRIARLSEVDILVTDRLPSPEIAELCQRHEVRVVETGRDGVDEP